ncbi:MAG TPA: hypothetical protein VHB79_32940 [Polyangiaceae bacterium]|nr:hypothetical protein [Polyangiaceae bacterium]
MPLTLDFTWTAPDTCPTQAEVVEQLSRAVDADEKELPPLVARATVSRDAGGWHLELATEMDGRNGTRQLEAESCEGLARAATLVLALTLGEGLARRQAEAEAARTKPPPPAPPPPAPPPPPAKPEPPARATRILSWNAGVGADALGEWGPAFSLGFAYQPTWIEIGLAARVSLPRSSALPGGAGDVRSMSMGAALDACVAPTLGSFQWRGCLQGGLDWLFAQGQGTERDRKAAIPLYSLGPRVGVRWHLSEHAFVGLAGGASWFVKRPELVVEGSSERRHIEPFALGAELGGGVRW